MSLWFVGQECSVCGVVWEYRKAYHNQPHTKSCTWHAEMKNEIEESKIKTDKKEETFKDQWANGICVCGCNTCNNQNPDHGACSYYNHDPWPEGKRVMTIGQFHHEADTEAARAAAMKIFPEKAMLVDFSAMVYTSTEKEHTNLWRWYAADQYAKIDKLREKGASSTDPTGLAKELMRSFAQRHPPPLADTKAFEEWFKRLVIK